MEKTAFLIGDRLGFLDSLALLEDYDYDILEIQTIGESLSALRQISPDLVLLHFEDGSLDLDTLCKLKDNLYSACVPVLLICDNLDSTERTAAFKAGVSDILPSVFEIIELEAKLRNYSLIAEQKQQIFAENRYLKRELSIRTAEIRADILNVKAAYGEILMRLSLAAEYKDPETGNHINRVAYYCREIADELGADSEFSRQIFLAAPMHDIGKIGIPDNILLKQGPLDKDEWSIMRSHTIIGREILKEPSDSALAMAQDIALCHHENYDGTGYPHKLSGEKIPMSAKIMAIADVYDALRSDRPYKKGFSHEMSFEIITKGDGRVEPRHFDPSVLEAFKKRDSIFREIYDGGGE